LLAGETTAGAFSVVHHVLAPGILAAPPHRHDGEDEFSYVIEGEVGFQLGNDVRTAGAGEMVAKPRSQFHTFWNAGEQTARVLELIAPAGFEEYFAKLAEIVPRVAGEMPDFEKLAAAAGRFGLEMDMGAVGEVMATHGVHLPGM
jgi:quercetin dioxygenase-like cupin family protein